MQRRKLWIISPGHIYVHLCKGFIPEGADNWNRKSTLKQATMCSSADQKYMYYLLVFNEASKCHDKSNLC